MSCHLMCAYGAERGSGVVLCAHMAGLEGCRAAVCAHTARGRAAAGGWLVWCCVRSDPAYVAAHARVESSVQAHRKHLFT